MAESTYLEDSIGSLPCFRCGICCVKYQVLVTEAEAEQIINGLGITWQQWRDDYIHPRWPGTDTFIVRQTDGACIFLERSQTDNATRCRIQPFKPQSCQEWTAGAEQRECREGLSRWGLILSPSGRIEGDCAKLSGFRSFLESLTPAVGDAHPTL